MKRIKVYHLYKIHENNDCATLLNITRYLYYQKINIIPTFITERLIPRDTILPTITLENNRIFSGLNDIVNFLEEETEINNLVEKANIFVSNNPEFRCRK